MSTEKVNKIRLRGHHLFCINVMQNWTLWGPEFWENVKKYKEVLETPDLIIEVVRYCGDTCVFCPCNREGKCELYDFSEGGNGIDLEILEQLGLNIGDEIISRELGRLIRENFLHMPSICIWGCGVTNAGCLEGLEKLKSRE